MKVVLSRKGFDSSIGGHASPILPDGKMVSLPIPSSHDTLRYEDVLTRAGMTCTQLLRELHSNADLTGKGAHLDPDLSASSLSHRPRGWRPSLGQNNQAASHLQDQEVGLGDLFLFYGWFKRTIRSGDRLRFEADSSSHTIFGYLEISEVYRTLNNMALPSWMSSHLHCALHRVNNRHNMIYVATDRLSWNRSLPGAGLFDYSQRQVLTAPGRSRSKWSLDPAVFGDANISYHSANAWRAGYFQSYSRGQEYVIQDTANVERWAQDLVSACAISERLPD